MILAHKLRGVLGEPEVGVEAEVGGSGQKSGLVLVPMLHKVLGGKS